MHLYYTLRPFMPRRLQLALRRTYIRLNRERFEEAWPIDPAAAVLPHNWPGWPEGKAFAVVLTHDVEHGLGQSRCRAMARLETEHGFRSSFGFVPERYDVAPDLREDLAGQGFEIHVHGLLHDGKLIRSEAVFAERARRINHYLAAWNADGFRAPSMHHNLEWFHALNILYDSSTFDTDPYQPQPDGVRTIFPFWVEGPKGGGYVELPYTLDQDFTLFCLLQHRTIDVWKRKLAWVAEQGGMVLLNTHPDYVYLETDRFAFDSYPIRLYREFLEHLAGEYEGAYWHALPREVAHYMKRAWGK